MIADTDITFIIKHLSIYMSKAQKSGYRIDEIVHALLKQLSELMAGMLTDAQAGWCDFTVQAKGFSHQKKGSR